MASPLWTDRYAPTIDQLPQAHLQRYLERASAQPINLLLHGPPGAGKSAAARALTNAVHPDPETDVLEINVADFFDRTKAEIEEDPRFAHFFSDSVRRSKREMITHVFQEATGHAPVSGHYRTVILDNAESVRRDFQQALRRLIERHHETTQFILTTRHLGKIIPALRSRCLPVPVPAPDDEAIVDRVATILEAESIEYDDVALSLLANEANGNLRRAVLVAQAAHTASLRDGDGRVTESAVFHTVNDLGHADTLEQMLDAAESGRFDDARSTLDELLVDEGLDGAEILEQLLTLGRTRFDEQAAAAFTEHVAEVEFMLTAGGGDRIQLSRLLADLGRGDLGG